jgi:hypothetical protein
MKAQSLRRLLTLANVGLALAIVGAGAWYVIKIRPASAEDANRGKWVKASAEAQQIDQDKAKPNPSWSVDEKAFDHIIRPDLMDRKRGPGVWPFVGQVPPKFVPLTETKAETQKAPEGLAAMGHIAQAWLGGPNGLSVITFVFNGKNTHRTFAVGDRDPIADIELTTKDRMASSEGPAKRAPGKYLVSVEMVGVKGGDPQLKVVYDEITDPDKAPDRKEEILALKQDPPPEKVRFSDPDGSTKPPAVKPAVGPVAGGPAAPGGPKVAAPPARVRIEPREVSPNVYGIEFTQEDFDSLSGSAGEDLIKDVKTEDVTDDRGGVRAAGISPGSIANQFGVQPGDILRSINGVAVHSRDEALSVVKTIPKDTKLVTVVLTRDGQDRTYMVDPRDPKVRSGAGSVIFKPAPKK